MERISPRPSGRETSSRLARPVQRNIPFTVAVAGDDWLDYRRTRASERIQGRCRDEGRRHGRPSACIDRQAPGRRPPGDVADEARLDKLVPTPVQIEGTDQVMAVVRAVPGDQRSPLAVHLLNRRYDRQKDGMVPLAAFGLRLRQDVLGERRITQALLHSPRSKPVPTEVRHDKDSVVIKIPAWTSGPYWSFSTRQDSSQPERPNNPCVSRRRVCRNEREHGQPPVESSVWLWPP